MIYVEIWATSAFALVLFAILYDYSKKMQPVKHLLTDDEARRVLKEIRDLPEIEPERELPSNLL